MARLIDANKIIKALVYTWQNGEASASSFSFAWV